VRDDLRGADGSMRLGAVAFAVDSAVGMTAGFRRCRTGWSPPTSTCGSSPRGPVRTKALTLTPVHRCSPRRAARRGPPRRSRLRTTLVVAGGAAQIPWRDATAGPADDRSATDGRRSARASGRASQLTWSTSCTTRRASCTAACTHSLPGRAPLVDDASPACRSLHGPGARRPRRPPCWPAGDSVTMRVGVRPRRPTGSVLALITVHWTTAR
jgi:hypothetical protein